MRKKIKSLFWFLFTIAAVYGGVRLYYSITDGFREANIVSEFAYNEKWELHPQLGEQKALVDSILAQKFTYLGKGCQSYVFQSEDGKYVLKFVKYQRFRPQAWLDYFAAIPFLNDYRLSKIQKKEKKLDMLFTSWKIAYEHLQSETGLVFVHLNKSKGVLSKTLLIYDKLGIEHRLDADQMEFLIQKRASMLCSSIEKLMAEHQAEQAKQLLSRLLALVLSEYERGIADNDHALMQNTGVLNGAPIHIDAGQFVFNAEMKSPDIFHQELFSKTFKFRKWLAKRFPELANYLDDLLYDIMGEKLYHLQPQVKNHAWSE